MKSEFTLFYKLNLNKLYFPISAQDPSTSSSSPFKLNGFTLGCRERVRRANLFKKKPKVFMFVPTVRLKLEQGSESVRGRKTPVL